MIPAPCIDDIATGGELVRDVLQCLPRDAELLSICNRIAMVEIPGEGRAAPALDCSVNLAPFKSCGPGGLRRVRSASLATLAATLPAGELPAGFGSPLGLAEAQERQKQRRLAWRQHAGG